MVSPSSFSPCSEQIAEEHATIFQVGVLKFLNLQRQLRREREGEGEGEGEREGGRGRGTEGGRGRREGGREGEVNANIGVTRIEQMQVTE